ncbi:MAG: hypothetical protein GC185_01845 [Alphaproteobacteria bacterium]|nr:hypothetical protein [Alphaproteobacteria bacterium]
MTALTQDKATPQSAGDYLDAPVASGKKIYTGALVAMSSTGYITPGATATTLKGVGVAQEQVDNTDGADGDVTVRVDRRPYWISNSDTDPVGLEDIKADCYIVDDQTVAKTNGTNTRSVAGKIMNVDANLGVLVDFR